MCIHMHFNAIRNDIKWNGWMDACMCAICILLYVDDGGDDLKRNNIKVETSL